MTTVVCDEAYGGEVFQISSSRSFFPSSIIRSWFRSFDGSLCAVHHDENAEELSSDHLAVCGLKSSPRPLTIGLQ